MPTSDTTLTLMRLVRSVVGYPVSISDGEVLVDSDSVLDTISYADDNIEPGTRYYYGLFVYSSDLQSWVPAGTTTAVATLTVDTGARMFQLIPATYRQQDTTGFLARFLSVLGYQFDVLRTEAASVATITNPQSGHALGVASALNAFGLTAEPELGFAAQRQLLSVASQLFIAKGTPLAARVLATALTGWSAAVFPGANLLLDDLDSSGNGSVGRWKGTTLGSVSFRAGDGTINAPWGLGMLDITAPTTAASVSFVNNDGIEALLQGVPVVGGAAYDAGAIFRYSVTGAGPNVTLIISWYDATGTFISQTSASTVNPVLANWNTTALISNATAPSTARRAALRIATGTITAGRHIYAANLFLAEHNTMTAWEPARLVKVTLGADHVNELPNPRFAIDTSNWAVTAVTGVSIAGASVARVTGTDGPPPASTTYGRITATAALQGAWTKTIYGMQTDSLVTGKLWARSSVGGTIYMVSDDTLVTPAMIAVPGDGAWHEINVPLVTGVSYQRLTLLATLANAGTMDIGGAMVNLGDPVPYFDGSFTSSTGDYMWETNPHTSRSHNYVNRSVKASRLRSVLPQFLPPSLQYVLLFAQAPSLSPGAYGVGPYGSGAYGIGGI